MSKLTREDLISQSLATVIAPAVAYFAAFIFQLGYFTHFSIPLDLIRVDLSSALLALTRLIIALPIILYVFAFYWIGFGRLQGSDKMSFQFLFYTIIFWFFFGANSGLTLYFAFLAVIPTLRKYIGARLSRVDDLDERIKVLKEKNSIYMLKLYQKMRELMLKSTDLSNYRKFPDGPISRWVAQMFNLLLPIGSMFYILGHYQAVHQKEFSVVGDTSEVVLRMYGDNFITAHVNSQGKIERVYNIYPINTANGRTLKLKKIGPLVVQP